MFRFLSNACFFAAILFSSTVFADNEEAKAVFNEGSNYFSAQEYDKAATAFRSAYELKPSWKILFNIGQAEAAAKRYGLALESFERYLAQAGDDVQRAREQEVMAEITRLRMLIGILKVEAPDGTALLLDGVARGKVPFPGPVRVAVGKHTATLTREGEVVLEKTINIAGDMTTTISYAPDASNDAQPNVEENIQPAQQPEDAVSTESDSAPASEPAADATGGEASVAPKGLLVGGIISSVMAAGGIGVGVVFSVKYADASDAWETAKSDYQSSGTNDDFLRAKQANDDLSLDSTLLKVGFISGGVLAAASVVMLVIYKKRQYSSQTVLYPSLGGLTITF